MSKNTITVTQFPVAKVAFLPSTQEGEREESWGSPYGDFSLLFAQSGWDMAQGTVSAWASSKAEAAEVNAWRKAEIRRLSEASQAFPVTIGDDGKPDKVIQSPRLALFAQELWFPNGKPTFKEGDPLVNICNRRTCAGPACLLAYKMLNGDEAEYLVPVNVRTYADEAEKLLERVKENSDAGRSGLNEVNRLVQAIKLIKFTGCVESDLMRSCQVSRGMAQKLFGWACLCIAHPLLALEARARMPQPQDSDGSPLKRPAYDDKGFYPYRKLKPNCARQLAGGATEDAKVDKILVETVFDGNMTGAKAMLDDTSDVMIEAYIKGTMDGTKNAPSILAKTDWDNLVKLVDASFKEAKDAIRNGVLANERGVVLSFLNQAFSWRERNRELIAEIKGLNKLLKADAKAATVRKG